MNTRRMKIVGFGLGLVTGGLIQLRAHARKQKQMDELSRELRSLWTAAGIVGERVRSGSRRYASVEDVMTDFEFERIRLDMEGEIHGQGTQR